MADYAALHAPHAELLRAALERATPRGATLALDLGCGPGAKTGWLAACAAPNALVVGADIDRVALRIAGTGAWLAADAHALPLRSASIELVWCVATLSLFDDQRRALAEVCRVLQPGGTFVVAVATERWVRLRVCPPGTTLPTTSQLPADDLGAELGDALVAAGLEASTLAAYLLDPPGLALAAAAMPLLDHEHESALDEEPEMRSVLLVATGRTPAQ